MSENPLSHAAAAFGKCELDAQKRRRGAKPLLLDSLYPGYLPASSLSPKPSGRLGSNPYAWNAFRGHARYACRRTPRQTSGLPAGAEPSFESKYIIASTNPECPDTFEYNRTTRLHRYTVTEPQSYMATWKGYGDHFAAQTVGAITLGAPALKRSCRMLAEMFQLVQSRVRERQLKNILCTSVIFEKSILPKLILSRLEQLENIMPVAVGKPFHPAKLTFLSE